ncbi:hypothetical protein [Sinomonas humi]|uniref:Secreted protein n=1 Tax=Sinomonas humi TaxID=1338436 RepID=A0A0B2AP03_9MICC|nr:hypothetical protein [Sinomonas humi]KHL05127.1 hypothetical protein LK10_02330 [Sinomonas humi]
MKAPRTAMAGVAVAALAAAAFATAAPASASYGGKAAYQIALSDNISGKQGGGVWIWWALNSDGTGDYSGSDCGHGGGGAASDKGDVTWNYSTDGTQIIIHGTVLNGLGGYESTVTIPATFGHYTGTDESFLTLPGFLPGGIGNAQLQVSP